MGRVRCEIVITQHPLASLLINLCLPCKQECSPGQPTLMGCYVIDINPNALGADSISVTDFRGNSFAMPKKFSDLTPGMYGAPLIGGPQVA